MTRWVSQYASAPAAGRQTQGKVPPAMSLIHRTTLTPTKLELLAEWLPRQPWYAGAERRPELVKAGGFRLDDPLGEVGVEFMVVTDRDGAAYHVPMGYRGAPLDGAEEAQTIMQNPALAGLSAVQNGAVHPFLFADRAAGVRIAHAIELLASLLHPDLAPAIQDETGQDGGE